jgi:hypothetical protein
VPHIHEVVIDSLDREFDEVLTLQGDRLSDIVIVKVKITISKSSIKGVNEDLYSVLFEIQ